MSGDTNFSITRWTQTILNVTENESLIRDGIFGPKTQAALMRFQASHSLPAHGVPDDTTRTALTQRALNHIEGANILNVDGIMGQKTIDKIKEFQSTHGLSGRDVDGVVGPITRAKMEEALLSEVVFPDDQIVPTPPTNVLVRSGAVLATQPFPTQQRTRLSCVLAKITEPGINDQYINGRDSIVIMIAGGLFPRMPPKEFVTKVLRESVKRDLANPLFAPPNESDEFVKQSLEALDDRINSGIVLVQKQMHRNAELNVRNEALIQMNEFISAQQRNPKSIYFCYGLGP
jgi:peptidoglycan hydrolase-like protein with peptidoglycan-binding domain